MECLFKSRVKSFHKVLGVPVILPSAGSVFQEFENLELWVKADSGIILDFGGTPTIKEWQSQSANNATFAQVTKSRQPVLLSNAINNQSAVVFNGTSTIISTRLYNFIPNFSIYLVAKRVNSTVASKKILNKNWNSDDTLSIEREGSNVKIRYQNLEYQDGFDIPTAWILGTADIISLVFDTTMTARLNGTIFGSTSFYTPPISTIPGASSNGFSLTLGGGSGTFFSGQIAEFLMYRASHNQQQRNAIHQYLSAKYNISVAV